MNTETLFNHFHQNHGLVLSEADIFEIIEIVQSLTGKVVKKRAYRGSFLVPEITEVKVYMESQNILNAEDNAKQFWNFYESKGWKVGNVSMKNWKAAIATWKLPTGKAGTKPITSSVFKNVGKNTENWMGK